MKLETEMYVMVLILLKVQALTSLLNIGDFFVCLVYLRVSAHSCIVFWKNLHKLKCLSESRSGLL